MRHVSCRFGQAPLNRGLRMVAARRVSALRAEIKKAFEADIRCQSAMIGQYLARRKPPQQITADRQFETRMNAIVYDAFS